MSQVGVDSALCPACLLELGMDHDMASASGFCTEISETGQVVGDYELLEELGRGGMGIVYRARQISLDREVAVKVLSPQLFNVAEALDRFRMEAQTAASLHHPGVVAIHEFGRSQDRWYLVMELVEGKSLAVLMGGQAIPAMRAARYLYEAAEAVHHAHAHGVLHRDLKPSNILVDSYDQVHITDFGLAKQTQAFTDLTLTGQVLGSPSFLSPEQAEGRIREVDSRSDVYALGAVLYQLLTARPPFVADSITGILTQVIQRDPVRPRLLAANVPTDLETICLKCLEKEPAARYGSARELADELSRFLQHQPIHARPVSPLERLVRWSRRNPAFAFVGATAALLLLVLLIGAPLATLRVAQEARRAVREQHRVQATLRRLELHHAFDAFENNRVSEGLAVLAAMVRRDPGDRVAAQWLLNSLVRLNYPLPVGTPFRHKSATQGAWFAMHGQGLITLSRDNAVQFWRTSRPAEPVYTFAHDPTPADPTRYTSTVSPIAAALSPDGHSLATASIDNTARIWSLETGQPLTAPLPHPDWVSAVAFSPDGRMIATACKDGRARLWDAATGDPRGAPLPHEQWVNFAVFSPDGRWLLTGADQGDAAVWEVATGTRVKTLSGHLRDVKYGAFSPDGRRLLTASSDSTARLWDLESGRVIGSPMTHNHIVVQGCFSPDGLLIATASFDHTVRLWDGYSANPLGLPLRHGGTVRWVAFSPEGERLVTASEDGTAMLWDVRTGEPLGEPIRHEGTVWSANFSPDGQSVVTSSADGTVRLWDVRESQALPLLLPTSAGVQSADWSADGAQIALAGHSVVTVNAKEGTFKIFQRQLKFTQALVCRLDREGRRLAVGNDDGTIQLRDAEDGAALVPPMRHDGLIQDLAFSPDGAWLASASSSGTVVVWESASGQRHGSALPHDGKVVDLQFSPDGRFLLTASTDGVARLFPFNEPRPIHEFRGHRQALVSAAFSPDARLILTASQDGSACVWDVTKGSRITGPVRHRGPLTFGRFSPDSQSFLTGCEDGTVGVWSAMDGRLIVPFVRQKASVVDGSFSNSGRWIVTGAVNGVARIWDAATGQLVDSLSHHSQRLTVAQFGTDDRQLLTASMDRAGAITELEWVPERAPAWLPQLAESVAGLRLDADRMAQQVTIQEALQTRVDLRSIPAHDSMGSWLTWFLADRTSRTISPRANLTLTAYVEQQRTMCIGKISRLQRLLRLAPNDAAITATLADAVLKGGNREHPGFLARAEWLIRRARELAWDHPELVKAQASYDQVRAQCEGFTQTATPDAPSRDSGD